MVNELRARELVRSPEHHQRVLRAPANLKHPRVLPAMPYSAISAVARAPAATLELAVVSSGLPTTQHPHRSTRGSKGSSTSPSTASPVPCSVFPHRAAVSGPAGVMSPVGLTCLTWGLTPPGSLTRGTCPCLV